MRLKRLIGVASQHSAVFKLDQHQNVWYFIDIAMEVDFVLRVKLEQKLRRLDVEVVSVFNVVDDRLSVEAEVVEKIMSKVTLVVPLITDFLQQLFVFFEGISLPFAHFIDISL